MKKRKRAVAWTTRPRESRLIPELRTVYQAISALGGPSYFEIARAQGLNETTVQRILACTGIQRPASGRNISNIEQIAEGLGYQLTLVPVAILDQVRALVLAHHASQAQAANQQTLWGTNGNTSDV